MGERSSTAGDAVKLRFTFFGGMYVDPKELLGSRAAQATMNEMRQALADVPRAPQGDSPRTDPQR